MNIVLSLFDHSGNWSLPWKQNGYTVIQIDKKLGQDILTWDYKQIPKEAVKVILAAIPCTDYALSGAVWFEFKDMMGITAHSNRIVKKTLEIINYFNPEVVAIENPASRIHKLNPELGEPKLKFNPYDYAGYDPIPENSQYPKRTWLWGKFNIPEKKQLADLIGYNPGWKHLGGKSEKTKELRSITPLGFAYAFYEANHA